MLTICLQYDRLMIVDNTSTQNIVSNGGDLMVDTLNLEKIVCESGKKKSYLAERCGITIQSLKNKFDNKSEFKLSEVDILCTELGITKLSDKDRIFFAK